MANIRVTGLPNSPGTQSTDVIHTVQGGVDYQDTVSGLQARLAQLTVTDNQSAVDLQTVSLPNQKNIVQCDTSLGTVTITLSDGIFDGQHVEVYCNGSSLTYVKGTGVYLGASSLGSPISDGLAFRATWSSTAGKWKPINEITADYTSGSQRIRQWSKGSMSIDLKQGVVFSASSAGSATLTYAVAFSIAPEILMSYNSPGAFPTNQARESYDSTSGASGVLRLTATSIITATHIYNIKVEGVY